MRAHRGVAVTALSGSGPAYFYFLVEAMTDAGILLGLPRAGAHDLIVQAAIGAAVMLRDAGEHPVKLREAVTSPAGTTISAIRELENHGVRAALIAALEAARDRSRELGVGVLTGGRGQGRSRSDFRSDRWPTSVRICLPTMPPSSRMIPLGSASRVNVSLVAATPAAARSKRPRGRTGPATTSKARRLGGW